jgi:hypothetical protein
MTDRESDDTRAAQPSLPDKVIAVHEAMRAVKIPHAIGGALALAYYAEPRATIDIDINVFVPPERWRDVIDALVPLGVNADRLDPAALLRDGQCRIWWGSNPIDIFFANDPIHDEMRKQARRLPFAGETLPFLAPEHLAVCKAIYDRPKDWMDIEQMLIATDELDVSEIERWLKQTLGDDDPRVRRLEQLRSRIGRS